MSGPKPPRIYVYISVIAIASSILILFFSGPISTDWKTFIQTENIFLSLLGYVLSPFIPIISLALLRNKDNQYRSDIFYDIGQGQSLVKLASLISLVGFIVGLFHIVRIAFILQGSS